jgi:Icc-related predicted phosphoesterase
VARHLSVEWPDPAPFRDRDGAPIRILAVSDEMDPALEDVRNRRSLGLIDLILGCGDLAGEDLTFVADLINAPLIYVRGNHDGDERWRRESKHLPDAAESTCIRRESGLAIAGLTWPGHKGKGAMRSERGAWRQALRLALRRLGRGEPMVIISHVPPLGAGDIESNGYHRGFDGYRWLLERLAPPLWLHGHTPLAACRDWVLVRGKTTVVNVSGAVLIELLPPGTGGAGGGKGDCPD